MLFSIIIATLIISLLSFTGLLILPTKKQVFIEIGVSLAVGALLGAVFLNILPEIFSNHHHESTNYSTEFYSLMILLSIMLFFLIERFFHWHHCHGHDDCHQCIKPMGWINIFGDGLHNFVDGMIIGASFVIDSHLGIITTVAIALHEIPQEIGDFSILIKAGFSKSKAMLWNLFSALLAVAGGILAFFFTQAKDYSLLLLSIAAGSFLYLAMSDIIPQLHHSDRKHHNMQLIGIILGLFLIYLGNILLPHSH